MEMLNEFLAANPKSGGVIISAIVALLTAMLTFAYRILSVNKFKRLSSTTATIDLISKLDAEYAKYLGKPTGDTAIIPRDKLEERKNEVKYLKQIAYANLTGYTLYLGVIEKLQKSDNPVFSIRLYSQYLNSFKAFDGSSIELEDNPKGFGWKALMLAILFFALGAVGFTAIINGEGGANIGVSILITLLLSASAVVILIKAIDYLSLDVDMLKKNVVDVSKRELVPKVEKDNKNNQLN
jgi:hypothetical protein